MGLDVLVKNKPLKAQHLSRGGNHGPTRTEAPGAQSRCRYVSILFSDNKRLLKTPTPSNESQGRPVIVGVLH